MTNWTDQEKYPVQRHDKLLNGEKSDYYESNVAYGQSSGGGKGSQHPVEHLNGVLERWVPLLVAITATLVAATALTNAIVSFFK